MDYFGKSVIDNLGILIEGFKTTIALSIIAAFLSLAIGVVVAVMRIAPTGGLRLIGAVYVEFFRNTPLLVQAYAVYFGLPKLGVRLDPFIAGTIALSLYTGAYVAETVRSGILSIPTGQTEAARSLGLGYIQTLRLVILPQALRIVLPPLGNLLIAMVKNSAIMSSIGLAELMFQGEKLNSDTFRTFEAFTAVIIGYLILTLPLAWGVSWLEGKLNPTRQAKPSLKGASV